MIPYLWFDFHLIFSEKLWSYGSKPAGYHVTGMFSLFTNLAPLVDGIVSWHDGPGVHYNTKPTTVITGSVIFPGNSVAMHPGENGSFSVVRFTAPKDGNYVLDATFAHIDTNALHTGVYVIYNNLITLWEIDLAGPEDLKSFKTTISVKANEPIDFIVGVGLDNSYVCDTTLAHVDIHLLENQSGFPIITVSIGFVLGIIISAISYVLPIE
ncbi:PEP-CTERM sorting domain-containing protein [Rhizophagus clarus]|uniref:PEP-CTERM sorting domain-containing protein n=1 Tax=Rhizophagus clarus TaxID=94130 RepID=A0A8H3M022_9GLOM|nr:PEP-CTERM sorting domain-containing protein [Rhizophagus clarus]